MANDNPTVWVEVRYGHDGVLYDSMEIEPEDDIDDPPWAAAIGKDTVQMIRDARERWRRNHDSFGMGIR